MSKSRQTQALQYWLVLFCVALLARLSRSFLRSGICHFFTSGGPYFSLPCKFPSFHASSWYLAYNFRLVSLELLPATVMKRVVHAKSSRSILCVGFPCCGLGGTSGRDHINLGPSSSWPAAPKQVELVGHYHEVQNEGHACYVRGLSLVEGSWDATVVLEDGSCQEIIVKVRGVICC